MSNDVQAHDSAAERASGADRRTNARHAASSLGTVQARIIGGSPVDLVNFSQRGVLFECDSRMLIGARASVRITTADANLVVSGKVVRSRVKGLVNGALRYDAALALDSELALTPSIVETLTQATAHAGDGAFEPAPVEEYLAESEASLAEAVREREMASEPAAAEALDEPPADATIESAIETAAVADPEEAVAFEADEAIAFEQDADFAFEAVEETAAAVVGADAPAAAIDEPPPLFEARYVAPEEAPAGTSMFEASPQPAADAFDGIDVRVTVVDAPAAGDADIAFESEVAFEAEDAVMFESAMEAAPAADVPADALADVTPPPLDAAPDVPAAVPETEDHVLVQFAATVPHGLADLRRIAADNQW